MPPSVSRASRTGQGFLGISPAGHTQLPCDELIREIYCVGEIAILNRVAGPGRSSWPVQRDADGSKAKHRRSNGTLVLEEFENHDRVAIHVYY